MMISFPGLSKLKTKQVVYEEVFAVCDSITLEQLKETSSRRRAIEESINESSTVTEAIAREMSGGLTSRCDQDVQKLENYLPLLENLVYHVSLRLDNLSMVGWIADLKFRWTSALVSSSVFPLKFPQYYQINDLRFEYGMVLSLYGSMLRDKALESLQNDLVISATLLRKASGVYQHLANEVLPALKLAKAIERPAESVPSVSSVMSLICLAEAQAVTAKKAEEKGNSHYILSKLHNGVRDFLDEASSILHSANKECKNITSRLSDFIANGKMLHRLKSHKYLAESLMNDGKIGVAVGVLQRVLKGVEKISPKDDSSRLVFKQLITEMTDLKRKYERENDFVWHEKIPSQHELPSAESVKLVSLVPYQPQRLEQSLLFRE